MYMSVFKVKLTNVNQGLLDTNGQSTGTSVQRGVWIMGPNKVNRLLIDGSTFTDSNYWKRYAYPQVPYDQAIVDVLTDDGSVWADNPVGARTFGVSSSFTGTASYSTTNTIDYLSTYGSYAKYVQIKVTTADATVRINGSVEITVASGTTQIFDDDIDIAKLEVKGSSPVVAIFAAVRSVQNT
jgi:hypothetical protein